MNPNVFFLISEPEVFAPWLAPYLLGFVILIFFVYLFRIFENWYSLKNHQPLVRDVFVYKKLTPKQREYLEKTAPFYANLAPKQQKRFRHRVANFISKTDFMGRDGFKITDEVQLTIAANACMLSFGRKNYLYKLVDYVLVFPTAFYSEISGNERESEFNPRKKAVVLSAENSLDSKPDENPIVFEFMHAMQLEARIKSDLDSQRFEQNYQNLLHRLLDAELKTKLEEEMLKSRRFSNEFEFLAILVECFFQDSTRFQTDFPEVFTDIKRMLGFRTQWVSET